MYYIYQYQKQIELTTCIHNQLYIAKDHRSVILHITVLWL